MDPPDNFPQKLLTRTFFRVNFLTHLNENVIVVGSDPHLGNWEVDKAHTLISSEEHLPVWYSPNPVPLPLNKTVQYKYAAYNPSNKLIRWESQEVNRSVKPTGETMHVEDDNGLFRLKNSLHVPLTDDEVEVAQNSRQIEAQRKYEQYKNDVKLDGDSYLHVVSMELPIRVGRTENDEFFVESRKSSLIPSLYNLHNNSPLEVKFFGWPGIHPKSIEEKERLTDWLETTHNCVPIFPREEALAGCLKFCNNFLWPIFHNVMPFNLEILEPETNDLWKNYQDVNYTFAEIIANHSREKDMIWIHNYHHLVLPHFLTRRSKRLNIGLFLHIPFPSNEVFRCIPMREQIIKGMLFADLLGFHICEYAYNFFGACAYLSGYQQSPRFGGGFTLECDGRNVSVHVNHVHIQYNDLRIKIEGSDVVKHNTHQIQERFKDKFIFASVDRCEVMAGIIHKFLAFQALLNSYPACRGKAVLIQYAYPIESMQSHTKQYQKELEKLSNSINKKFQTKDNEKHIYLYVSEISWEEKFSLFQATDCFLDTSISDGFNMNPSEFICCRKDRPASLILSEFIGCARSHSSSIRINPWQIEEVANMMDKVIHHPDTEAKWEAFNRDQEYLQTHTTMDWAEEFLKDLKKAKKPDNMNYVLCGFATSRLVGTPLNFSWLDSNLVIDALKISKRRYFFFDYEGTLAFDRRRVNALPDHDFDKLFSNGTSPLEGVKTCLRELLSDTHNTVVILSGRDRSHLEKWFNGVDRLGLCAEHGYYYKVPSLTNTHWHCVSNNVDLTWKNLTREILSNYVKRTQGSFIENKGSALVFQYRDAHPEFGLFQANDLSNNLKNILSGYPVSVVQGKGYVEVRLYGINKGQAVQNILNQLTSSYGEADFILCIGDDRSDEDMFEEINKREEIISRSRNGSIDNEESFFNNQISNTFMSSLNSEEISSLYNSSSMESNFLKRISTPSTSANHGNPRRYFTCTVGQKSSKACYYLNDTGEVTALLSSIVTAMHKMSATHTS